MVLPGHLAGGYLATTALLAIFHPDLSLAQTNALIIIGTLAGDAPDIDLVKLYFDNRPNGSHATDNHHSYMTHAPLFWLVSSLLIVAFGFIFNSLFTQWCGWLILSGSWTHLLLDYIEFDVRWFWPFSNKYFTLIKREHSKDITARPGTISNYLQFITKEYIKSATFWLEIIVTITALCILAHRL
jgi:LexA-binding, inner membrane-associated putative hydrolase